MKAIVIALLGTLIGVWVFAADVTLRGNQSEALLSALEGAGSVVDCGMGTCGTFVSGVRCYRQKLRNEYPVCILNIVNSAGRQLPRELEGKSADNLINAMAASGLVSCGSENCGFVATEIHCTYKRGYDSTECRIR